VIMECVALTIMISNDLVIPVMLRRRSLSRGPASGNMGGLILGIRRIAILALMLLAYAYFRNMGAAALSSIGLISFSAIAQIGPAFFGGLFWRRGNALGATAGLAAGIVVWAAMLLIPSMASIEWIQGLQAIGI